MLWTNTFQTFDNQSQELLRVNTFVPAMVTAGGQILPRLNHISDLNQQEGYTLGADGDLPSVLRIRHDHASVIVISGNIILWAARACRRGAPAG